MHRPVSTARTGIWIGIGAITMSFGAYTSALVFRGGASGGWEHVRLPPLLYFNTVLLLVSSATMALGQRRVRWSWLQAAAGASGDRDLPDGMAWLYATLVLGLLFIAGQVLAWQDLARQGLFLASNPGSSFFYLFTGLHALHLLGGLVGLGYVLRRLRAPAAAPAEGALSAIGLYWHFMDGLWIYLLLLLNFWL
jgi:cytochrome c oxidase subunit III